MPLMILQKSIRGINTKNWYVGGGVETSQEPYWELSTFTNSVSKCLVGIVPSGNAGKLVKSFCVSYLKNYPKNVSSHQLLSQKTILDGDDHEKKFWKTEFYALEVLKKRLMTSKKGPLLKCFN